MTALPGAHDERPSTHHGAQEPFVAEMADGGADGVAADFEFVAHGGLAGDLPLSRVFAGLDSPPDDRRDLEVDRVGSQEIHVHSSTVDVEEHGYPLRPVVRRVPTGANRWLLFATSLHRKNVGAAGLRTGSTAAPTLRRTAAPGDVRAQGPRTTGRGKWSPLRQPRSPVPAPGFYRRAARPSRRGGASPVTVPDRCAPPPEEGGDR